MSAHPASTALPEALPNSRGPRMLFALLAAAHLVKTFWSLENLLFVELAQNLAASVALALFAANFHLAPRRSLPYRAVWLAVIVTVAAMAADILLALDP